MFKTHTNCFILFMNTYKNYKRAQYATKVLRFELYTPYEVNSYGNTDNPIRGLPIRNIHKNPSNSEPSNDHNY